MLFLLATILIGLGSMTPAAADDVAAARGVIRAQEQQVAMTMRLQPILTRGAGDQAVVRPPTISMFMVQNSYVPTTATRSFEFGGAASKAATSRNASTSSTPTAMPEEVPYAGEATRRQPTREMPSKAGQAVSTNPGPTSISIG